MLAATPYLNQSATACMFRLSVSPKEWAGGGDARQSDHGEHGDH
jgi:hypothetical protein